MIQPQTALSTIKEENESDISTLTASQSENNEENLSAATEVEKPSKTSIPMRTNTVSIDTDASSYQCFKEIVMSSSSIFQNPLYFFPDMDDPGIQEAFETEAQEPPDDYGCRTYKNMCKEMKIYPISKVCKSLGTEKLNLKYYVPFEKQMKAICKVLENNKYIQELNLQDNWLSVESCTYLAALFEMNLTLKVLKLKECRIGSEGIAVLSEALEMSSLQELDLSFNSLGNEGLSAAKTSLSSMANLAKLNLSHNEFTENSAVHLYEILVESQRLKELDLSWNCLNSPSCTKKLCLGLLQNLSLERLNISWNGIATEHTVFPFVKYLTQNTSLKYLDMSNNLIGGPSLEILMKGVAESNSLEQFKIGNNVFSPQQAFECAEILARPREKPLKVIDMENMVVQKKFLNLLENIKEQGNNVIYGAVLTDYEIHGPYLPKVLFGRCKYLGMKPKKKKNRIDFGHFVLSLPKDPISPEEFQAALVARKLNTLLDSDLINSVLNQYMIKKTRKIDCSQLVSDYMVLYPDTQPEPPKKKKPQKEKPTSKKSKMTKKIAPDTSGQPPEDTVRFELPEEQKLQSAVERSVEKITDIKMSIAQSENSVLTKEQQITAQGSRSSTKQSVSKSSLSEKSATILKKQRHVSYGNVQEKHESNTKMDQGEANEQNSTLNASGVFIMESSKPEN